MENNFIPSQLYQRKKTLLDHPNIQKIQDDLLRHSIINGFIKKDGTNMKCRGRTYDDTLILHNIDFNNKVVCELGARDSIIGPYVTDIADSVYVSDYFEEWGKNTLNDLGHYDYWRKIWVKNAKNPMKLVTNTENILNLSFNDNFFDIVIAKSVINHTYNQNVNRLDGTFNGDMLAMNELYRVTKPNGIVVISLLVGDIDKWESGTYIYTLPTLKERLFNGFEIIGNIDSDFNNKYNDGVHEFHNIYPVSDAIFFLRKVKKVIL